MTAKTCTQSLLRNFCARNDPTTIASKLRRSGELRSAVGWNPVAGNSSTSSCPSLRQVASDGKAGAAGRSQILIRRCRPATMETVSLFSE
jgi:hypothetical protein